MSTQIRQPLLNLEQEEKLKLDFKELWDAKDENGKWKYTSLEIAEQLGFGKPGTYEKLKPHYIRYYRQKFEAQHQEKPDKFPLSFPRRRTPAFELGEHRYINHPKTLGLLSFSEFEEKLNEILPYSNNFYIRRKRSFLILLFWTPLRESELYERVYIKEKEDFEITPTHLVIHLLRKKKKTHDDSDEPIKIPKALPLVNEVIKWLQDAEWRRMVPVRDKRGRKIKENGKVKELLNLRPWKIGSQTAWNYVHEVFGDRVPHYFRYNYITDGANDPNVSLRHLKAKTRLTLAALEKYVFTDERAEDEFDKLKLKRLKAQGEIK
jgi:hypothetical protein